MKKQPLPRPAVTASVTTSTLARVGGGVEGDELARNVKNFDKPRRDYIA